jgi:Cu(I)/Ag(I) efflux system membrane fusion protein/cobalt-zinc-cadmium efflux system membrane fusion protein
VVQNASELLNAAQQRLLYWDITEAQIAALKKTGQVKRTMTVFAPRSGIVTHKNVLEGAYIRSGEHLYRIANLSKVWVYADLYEYELPWIAEGQVAEVRLSYLQGETFRGRVDYIFPFMEKKTRTVRVRMAFDNVDGALKPDMFADVVIQPEVAREAVVVPAQAVIHSGTRRVVVIALGAGKFEPREIHLGVETEDGYEVKHGLETGEKIVTSAQFLIDSESNLKAALAGMGNNGTEGAGHQH